MGNESIKGIHWSFWIISVLALLWNVGGTINYLMQTNIEFVSTLPESHRAIIEGRPTWATAGFALGVFGGSIGSLLILLRKPISFYVFIMSFIGMIVTMIHTTNVASSKIDFNYGEIFVMILLPIIVAVFLMWYAKHLMNKGWLN